MAFENSTRFCVFCYRNDDRLITSLNESKNIYLFFKLFGRFYTNSDNNFEKQLQSNQLKELSLSQLLGCCEGCLVIVNGFCKIYHQYKCVEMQLEWKVKMLANIVKLSNRVPSRVSMVNRALQIKQTGDRKEKPDQTENIKLKVLRSFRHCFAKQCRRKLKKSQPRVFMRMKLPEQSSYNDPNPVTEVPLINQIKIQSAEKSTPNFQRAEINDPKTTNVPYIDSTCQDAIPNDQDNVSENGMDDDSTTHHDYSDEPLNCNDFTADDTQEEHNNAPVQNINKNSEPAVQAKLEFPLVQNQISEDSVSETVQQFITQPTSSLTIENVISSLPFSVNEVRSKTLLCTICNKHCISEDCLNKHLQKDHSKTVSKIERPFNLKTEAGDQDNDVSLIEICTERESITTVATTSSQPRYSLREKRSTVKYNDNDEINDTDNNNMEYTADPSCSSASDSDENDVKPVIKPKKSEPKIPQKKFEIVYCEICNKKSTTKFLDAHTKTWHDTTGIDENQIKRCEKPKCLAYFLTKEQLSFHLRNEHNKIFRCHFCHKRFPQKVLLARHIRKVHKKSLYNPLKCLEDQPSKPIDFHCKFCNFITTSPTQLAIHETEHAVPLHDEPSTSKLRRCPRCPYKYAKIMPRHYVIHHLTQHLNYLTGESSGACKMCSKGKEFVENSKQHFDVHHNTDLLDDPTQVFKCDECPSYYLKSFQLHRHKVKIHTTLSCTDCERTFKNYHSYKVHMAKYHKDHELNPDLPLSCDFPNCMKRFSTEAELGNHKTFGHRIYPGDRNGPAICEICGKDFNSLGRLKVHLDKAHVEKNWVCSECGKNFRDKNNFDVHLEYHKGPDSWKFECNECGKKCVDKWKLASHLNTHTKEKPWICQFCGEKYAHRHNWKNHLKGKHMDEEGVEEIVNGKSSQRKGNYLSRKGTKKGDCIMSASGKL